MDSFVFGTIGGKSLELLERWGYGGAFMLSVLDRVTISLIPTEALVPLYGFLAGRGIFSFLLTFVILSFGALVGEVVLYWIFAKGGRPFLEKYGRYFLVHKEDLIRLDQLFTRHGQKFAFWGRFLPIARSVVAIPAGISRMDIRKFAVFSFLGLLPYNFLLFFLGQSAGENLERLRKYSNVAEKIVLVVLGLLVAWYIYKHLRQKH